MSCPSFAQKDGPIRKRMRKIQQRYCESSSGTDVLVLTPRRDSFLAVPTFKQDDERKCRERPLATFKLVNSVLELNYITGDHALTETATSGRGPRSPLCNRTVSSENTKGRVRLGNLIKFTPNNPGDS